VPLQGAVGLALVAVGLLSGLAWLVSGEPERVNYGRVAAGCLTVGVVLVQN